jgi:hypothetical protein
MDLFSVFIYTKISSTLILLREGENFIRVEISFLLYYIPLCCHWSCTKTCTCMVHKIWQCALSLFLCWHVLASYLFNTKIVLPYFKCLYFVCFYTFLPCAQCSLNLFCYICLSGHPIVKKDILCIMHLYVNYLMFIYYEIMLL